MQQHRTPRRGSDFALCPVLIVISLYLAIKGTQALATVGVVSYALAGLFGWTFLEYLVHRWLFHHAPVLRRMHEAHHTAPRGYVASPPGFLPAAAILIAYGLFWSWGTSAVAAVSAGALTGYLFYSFVHHATHHLPHLNHAYFMQARRRHMLHHFGSQDADFGVTTGVWDRVFGTMSRCDRLKAAKQNG
jgi:sterol desaturase/sphingolipid hydroxylase (fatty acid hydroxylase superfamily)